MKNFIFILAMAVTTLTSFTVYSEQESQQLSEAQLAQILAPIALYPDSLLTHILIASTYPIEIVEAYRWLQKNDEKSVKQLTRSVEDFDWDASVKALIAFERVLSRLNDDLSWTQQLGDAFLQDEARLLESIQTLRKKAELAGNLDKMANMDVSYEENNIIIEPVEKEVVYVPYYDTRRVYGAWYWSSYPPVYWSPHHSVHVSHYSPFYWHSGIHISFNYFFSAFHWHNRHVLVHNPHHAHYRYYHQRPRRSISRGGYAKRWSHQPTHRRGVAYRTKHVSQKYQTHRVKAHNKHKKLHFSQKSKVQREQAQRQFKTRLAEQGYAMKGAVSNKSKANKEYGVKKADSRSVPKQYYASVQSKKTQQKTQIKAQKKNTYREGNKGKNRSQHKNVSVNKQNHYSKRITSKPIKRQHTKTEKVRHQ